MRRSSHRLLARAAAAAAACGRHAAIGDGSFAPAAAAGAVCRCSISSTTSSSGSAAGHSSSSSSTGGSLTAAATCGLVAAAAAAATAAACGEQQQQDAQLQQPQRHHQTHSPWTCLLQPQPLRAAADAAPQQQWSSPPPSGSSSAGGAAGSGEPLSGAIAALDEAGLTNHPLDYNPITNEHTATMTLAKQDGIAAYTAGRYAEAERCFKEALEAAKQGFPPGDPHIPSALHYLAELYRNTGRLDEAEPLYRQTIEALGDSLGERHWMYSAALCSLAALHEARGEHDQALELLETALELRRQLFSSGSFLYADTAALLAKTLMQAHAAAAQEGSSSSSGGGTSWVRSLLSGGRSASAAVPPDVARAISLWQAAVSIVEDSGSVVDTPVVPWLLDMAAAQSGSGQHAAAVASLSKALEYMALPSQHTQVQAQAAQEQQQQQANNKQGAEAQHANSSSSSSDGGGGLQPGGDGGSDTMSAVLASCGGDASLARLKLAALGGEVAERLVDAQLAAGDVDGARATLRTALEARIALHGRHLVVAKTMTRLANLLMSPPAPSDPAYPQLALHFAASAMAIADASLQNAQRASVWGSTLRGALSALSSGGGQSGSDAERASERLLAALQLGNACLALAAAERLNGRPDEALAALRNAVSQLRWVLGVGADDLQRLSGGGGSVEAPLLSRVAGLLVDLKLLQMDCLEALAGAIRAGEQEGAAAGAAGGKAAPPAQSSKAAAAAAAEKQQQGGAGDAGEVDADEALMLLGEAELLAAELYAD